MKRKNYISILLIILSLSVVANAQYSRLSVTGIGHLQLQSGDSRASEGSGYGGVAQFNYNIGKRFRLNFAVGSDMMNLTQSDVLDEWQWDYWEDTYIDFLPGATVEIVNQTLRYDSNDSLFSARFSPDQNLKELTLGIGTDYSMSLSGKFSGVIGVQLGISKFKRELRMEEHWIKRFDLDSTVAGLDYEYEYDLLHFAPSKQGSKIFAAPQFGLNYQLSNSLALTAAGQYLVYFDRGSVEWLENLFGISDDGERWFPLKNKLRVGVGLTFSY